MISKRVIKLGGDEEELPPMFKEFKTIYQQEFGINLTDEEAYEKRMRLIALMKAIIACKQN